MTRDNTNNVSLTPELQRYVDGKIASGLYQSVSELIRDLLRRAKEQEEWRQDVRAKIEQGWQEAERGELVDGEQLMADLKRKLLAKKAAQRPKRKRA